MSTRSRAVLRSLFFLLAVSATGLGLFNVLGDNAAVVGQAESLVCGKPGCGANKVREERSPFSQSFVFQESRESQRTIAVRCRRAFLLLGEYQCENMTPAQR